MIPFVNIHTHQLLVQSSVKSISSFSVLETLLEPLPTQLFSAGIHPWYISNTNYNQQWNHLLQLVTQPNCVAIGECGLDKFKGPTLAVQERVFTQQIELAMASNKPVVVHCVGRYDVLLKVLKNNTNTVPFIVHGFNKNEQIANQLIEHGAYLSFGKSLLTSNSMGNIIKRIPLNKLFLENDDDAIEIEFIFEAAAKYKSCSINDLKQAIYNNFTHIFKE